MSTGLAGLASSTSLRTISHPVEPVNLPLVLHQVVLSFEPMLSLAPTTSPWTIKQCEIRIMTNFDMAFEVELASTGVEAAPKQANIVWTLHRRLLLVLDTRGKLASGSRECGSHVLIV